MGYSYTQLFWCGFKLTWKVAKKDVHDLKRGGLEIKRKFRERKRRKQNKMKRANEDILRGKVKCERYGNEFKFPTILLDLFGDMSSYRKNGYGEFGGILHMEFLQFCSKCLIEKYPLYKRKKHENKFFRC